MMKHILIVLLLISTALSQTTETKRPTADVDPGSGSSGCPDTLSSYSSSGSMTGAYDSSGTGTFSSLTPSASSFNTVGSGRTFNTWQTTSSTYTALSLNVNLACSDSPNQEGRCRVIYSLDGGTTFTQLFVSAGGVNVSQQTQTVSLSTSQNLSNIVVKVCAEAGSLSSGSTTETVNVFDVWTAGTIPAQNFGALPTDTDTVSPSVSTVHNIQTPVPSDTITVSPGIAVVHNIQSPVGETLSVGPSVSDQINRKPSLIDTTAVSPSVSLGLNMHEAVTELVTVSPSNAAVVGRVLAVPEFVFVTDVSLGAIARVTGDTLSISPGVSIQLNMHKNDNESVSMSVLTSMSSGNKKFLAEGVTLDVLTANLQAFSRSASETLTTTSSTPAVMGRKVSVSDTVAATLGVVVLRTAFATLSDAVQLDDNSLRTVALLRNLPEISRAVTCNYLESWQGGSGCYVDS